MYLLEMVSGDHEAEKRILSAALERKDSTIWAHMEDTAEVIDQTMLPLGDVISTIQFQPTLSRFVFFG